MTVRLVATILVLLAAAPPARAGDWLERSHVEWRPGVVSLVGDEFVGFKRDLAFALSAGVRVHPNVGVELSASWLEFATSPVDIGFSPRPDVPNVIMFTERLTPVMLDVKGVLPVDRLELYALAGAGVCFSTVDTNVTASASDAAFAWEAAAGFALRIHERVAVTGDVRRLSSSGTYRGGPAPIQLSWLYRHHTLETLVVGAGLAFRL